MSVKLNQNGSAVDIDLNYPGTATFIVGGHIDGIAIQALDGLVQAAGFMIGEYTVQAGANGSGPGGIGRALFIDDVPPPPPVYIESEYSLDLDAEDYVDLTNAVILTRNAACSFSWWEKVKAGSGVYPSRFWLRCDSGNAVVVLRSSDPNYAGLAVVDGGANDKKFPGCPSIASSVDVWRHFAVVFPQGTSGDTKLFVDGVEIASAGCPSASAPDQTVSRFGYDGGNNSANCLFDDIRAFDHALSQTEIDKLYAQEDITDGLTNYWAVENDLVDSVGSANGTNNGASFSTDTPTV